MIGIDDDTDELVEMYTLKIVNDEKASIYDYLLS